MPAYIIDVISLTANLLLIVFVVYYFFRISKRESDLDKKQIELEKKEGSIDSGYHQVVDTALAHERKILEDTQKEANRILHDTQFIDKAIKESLDKALEQVAVSFQHYATQSSQGYAQTYERTLKSITEHSLSELQTMTKQLQFDMQNQLEEFRGSILPEVQKEIQEYKESRLLAIEQSLYKALQRVAREVLNKSFTAEDQEKMVMDALEKAKKEGVLDDPFIQTH